VPIFRNAKAGGSTPLTGTNEIKAHSDVGLFHFPKGDRAARYVGWLFQRLKKRLFTERLLGKG
jgi:hypothetical protein